MRVFQPYDPNTTLKILMADCPPFSAVCYAILTVNLPAGWHSHLGTAALQFRRYRIFPHLHSSCTIL